MTMRYCASCDLKGLYPYTRWMGGQYEDGGWYELCENDKYAEDPHRAADAIDSHHTLMENKAYSIMWGAEHCVNRNGELTVICRMKDCVCHTLFAMMSGAIEREATEGTLDPEEWAPTFRKRTSELAAMCRGVAAAALADDLPPVLAAIIAAYLW